MTEAPEHILDPHVESLAIKLYEHSLDGRWPPGTVLSWLRITRDAREYWRSVAMGITPLPAWSPGVVGINPHAKATGGG